MSVDPGWIGVYTGLSAAVWLAYAYQLVLERRLHLERDELLKGAPARPRTHAHACMPRALAYTRSACVRAARGRSFPSPPVDAVGVACRKGLSG
jgi:hypothetical protein